MSEPQDFLQSTWLIVHGRLVRDGGAGSFMLITSTTAGSPELEDGHVDMTGRHVLV
jgi:hypothetical protein